MKSLASLVKSFTAAFTKMFKATICTVTTEAATIQPRMLLPRKYWYTESSPIDPMAYFESLATIEALLGTCPLDRPLSLHRS